MHIGARLFVLSLAVLGASAAAVAASDAPVTVTSTTCRESVVVSAGQTFWPVVLGRASLPLAAEPVRISGGRMRWWAKQGIGIRQGELPVVVSIPPAWRARIAIGWNNRGGVRASAERFPGCDGNGWIGAPGGPSDHFLTYPGGFYVAQRGCYPIDVRVGARTARRYVFVGAIDSTANRRCQVRNPS